MREIRSIPRKVLHSSHCTLRPTAYYDQAFNDQPKYDHIGGRTSKCPLRSILMASTVFGSPSRVQLASWKPRRRECAAASCSHEKTRILLNPGLFCLFVFEKHLGIVGMMDTDGRDVCVAWFRGRSAEGELGALPSNPAASGYRCPKRSLNLYTPVCWVFSSRHRCKGRVSG